MAVICSYSYASSVFAVLNPRTIKKSGLARRRKMMIMMSSSSDKQFSANINTKLQIRLPSKNKVFEDPSEGIVCYRDENGEITCEGIDEGPRFCHSSSIFGSCNQREAEIMELLQTSSNSIQMISDFRFVN